MTMMTPDAVDAQIGACDAAIANLESEAQQIALAATEGDAAAAARLGSINAEIEAMRRDRHILTQGRRAAEARAAVQDDAAKVGQRAADRQEARGHVIRLLDAARRANALVWQIAEVLADLAEAEAGARAAANRAGGILNSTRVGQHGAVGHAVDLITRSASGAIKINTVTRSVEDFARVGWRELIEESNDA
jgi:hypothetical protein